MGCLNTDDTFISPCVKYTLFFWNFLCWMIGGGFIGAGIWAFIEKNKYHGITSLDDALQNVSIAFVVLILIGIIIFIVSLCGCIGALRENVLLLKIYYYIMIIIFLFLIGLAVATFVLKDKVNDFLKHQVLKDSLITKYQDDRDDQAVIDWVQENFECCGVQSYKDWNKNQYYNCSSSLLTNSLRCSVPHSCCRVQDTYKSGMTNILCGRNVLNSAGDLSLIYTQGCVDAILSLVFSAKNLPVVGGVCIGILLPMLVGIFLARMLEGQILDQKERWLRYQG
ncbi:tetraspanin-33-like isoform X1 [Mytilus edulis]|uniref:Tetraspanin n=1 Tax=Mytilus edulis TaxID=6550 RepID=A0A8S3PZQ9_MYTED|nr:TSPAN33 [Mytilus edulis]